MTLNLKDLQSKISMLEKSNKVLTERLGRAEHKMGVILQWALSFPGIAASQGLAQLSSQISGIRPTGYQPTVRKRRPAANALARRQMIRGTVQKDGTTKVAGGTGTIPSTSRSMKMDANQSSSSAEGQGDTITVQVLHEGDTAELGDLENAVIPMVEASGGDNSETAELVQGENCTMEEVEVTSETKDIKVIQIRQARYVCTICGSGYSYAHGLSRHMNAAHERKSEYMCKFCNKTFHRKDKYRQHETLCVKKLTVYTEELDNKAKTPTQTAER